MEIAKTSAEDMKKAPRTTVVRVDDITAAKNLIREREAIPKKYPLFKCW